MGDWDTSDMLDTSDTDTDTDTAMDTCTARGLLMLSLRLRPIPTFSTVDSDTRIRTGTPPRLCWTSRIRIRTRIPRRILLRQVDSSRSFSEPTRTKMDCYQFELPFTSAAVSVLPY